MYDFRGTKIFSFKIKIFCLNSTVFPPWIRSTVPMLLNLPDRTVDFPIHSTMKCQLFSSLFAKLFSQKSKFVLKIEFLLKLNFCSKIGVLLKFEFFSQNRILPKILLLLKNRVFDQNLKF